MGQVEYHPVSKLDYRQLRGRMDREDCTQNLMTRRKMANRKELLKNGIKVNK